MLAQQVTPEIPVEIAPHRVDVIVVVLRIVVLDEERRPLNAVVVRPADVHHAHAWSLTSGVNVFSSHVCVADWRDGQRVLKEVTDLLRQQFNIYFSTTQIEDVCLDGEEGAEAIDVTRDRRSAQRGAHPVSGDAHEVGGNVDGEHRH